MASVKWLERIEVIDHAFDGVQQALQLPLSQLPPGEKGVPCTRMRVNSLMVPPGIPDYYGRRRTVDAGWVEDHGPRLVGRRRPSRRVEFAVDGAWQDAVLDPAAGAHAWRRWTRALEARRAARTNCAAGPPMRPAPCSRSIRRGM